MQSYRREIAKLKEEIEVLKAQPKLSGEALEILQQALSLKANAGGAIKRKIEVFLRMIEKDS